MESWVLMEENLNEYWHVQILAQGHSKRFHMIVNNYKPPYVYASVNLIEKSNGSIYSTEKINQDQQRISSAHVYLSNSNLLL